MSDMTNVIDGDQSATVRDPKLVAADVEYEKELHGDLDAKSHRIDNVSVLQTDELVIKSTPFSVWVSSMTKALQEWAMGFFAPKEHSHKEFASLEEKMTNALNKKQNTGKYATHDHTHPEHIHSLDVIERGFEIKDLLNHVTDLCPLQHAHPATDAAIVKIEKKLDGFCPKSHAHTETDSAIASLQAKINVILSIFEKKVNQDVIIELREWVRERDEAVDEHFKQIIRSIPQIPAEQTEMIASRYCLIPQKCNGKRLSDISAVGFDGNKIGEVEVSRGGQRIKIGSTVSTDDLLSFPPNCLVRLRFS